MVDRPGQRVADRVDAGAIVVEQHAVPPVATREHLPERAPIRTIDSQEQFGADRPRGARRGIDRRAAPAVHGKRDGPAVRRVVVDRAAAREGGGRIAVGDKGQRRVVEHDMHENRADLRAVGQTDGPAGMQQHLIVGRRLRFAEDVPGAFGFHGPLGRQKLGRQVQREAADQPAAGIVQLDRRGQALPPQLGLRPEEEGAVGVGRRAGLCDVGDELSGDDGHGVQLLTRAAEPRAQLVAMIQDLRRVLGGDGVLERRLLVADQRGIQRDGRQHERQVGHREARGLRGMSIAGNDPARRAGGGQDQRQRRQQRDQTRRQRSGAHPARHVQGRADKDGSHRKAPPVASTSHAPPGGRKPQHRHREPERGGIGAQQADRPARAAWRRRDTRQSSGRGCRTRGPHRSTAWRARPARRPPARQPPPAPARTTPAVARHASRGRVARDGRAPPDRTGARPA